MGFTGSISSKWSCKDIWKTISPSLPRANVSTSAIAVLFVSIYFLFAYHQKGCQTYWECGETGRKLNKRWKFHRELARHLCYWNELTATFNFFIARNAINILNFELCAKKRSSGLTKHDSFVRPRSNWYWFCGDPSTEQDSSKFLKASFSETSGISICIFMSDNLTVSIRSLVIFSAADAKAMHWFHVDAEFLKLCKRISVDEDLNFILLSLESKSLTPKLEFFSFGSSSSNS